MLWERHGYSKEKVYRCWTSIKERCCIPTSRQYKDYGGRGITICEEWKYPKNFIQWALNNGYDERLFIDRVDNDGNYEPLNCRFVDRKTNNEIGHRRMYSNNTSGYTGVRFKKRDKKWVATMRINNKETTIGSFKTKEEALTARINKEIEVFGEQRMNIK